MTVSRAQRRWIRHAKREEHRLRMAYDGRDCEQEVEHYEWLFGRATVPLAVFRPPRMPGKRKKRRTSGG